MNLSESESFEYFDQDSPNEEKKAILNEPDVRPKAKPRLFRQTAEKSETDIELSSFQDSNEGAKELCLSPRNSGRNLPQLSVTQSSPDIEPADNSDYEIDEIGETRVEEKSGKTSPEPTSNKKLLNRAKSLKRSFRLLKFHSRFRKSKSEDKAQPSASVLLSPTPSPGPDRSPSVASSVNQSSEGLNSQTDLSGGETDIFGIHVHNTDRKLKTSQPVLNPAVKVHVVDGRTGNYLLKKNKNRNVASYYENMNESVNYVLPLMTQPCDLLTRIRYPRYPIWEELLIYNEEFNHFVREGVILFLEVILFICKLS